MFKEYEEILISALSAAAKEASGGDDEKAKAIADRWIEDATAEHAAFLRRTPIGVSSCAHC